MPPSPPPRPDLPAAGAPDPAAAPSRPASRCAPGEDDEGFGGAIVREAAGRDDDEVVVVSGLSPPLADPWQAWLARRFVRARWVRPVDGQWPEIEAWARRIDTALSGPAGPRIVLAHGFGALALLRHAATGWRRAGAALLVTPARPQRFGLDGARLGGALRYPVALIAPLSAGDEESPWLKGEEARHWAAAWGCRLVDAGPGPGRAGWPEGERALQALRALPGVGAATPA